MKKYLLSLLLIAGILPAWAQEDTIRNLIISEWRGDNMASAYVELTNTGVAPVDLSKFTLATITPNVPYPTADVRHQKRLEGTLQPGESYLIMTVYEGLTGAGTPVTRTRMLPFADLKVYTIEGGVENDSVSVYDRLLRLFNGIYASVLWYNFESGDSVIVDAVNNAIDINTGRHFGVPSSVAGIESATYTHFLVRKANVTIGNPNWDNACGVTLEDSEWIPVPHDGVNPEGYIYTTVKVHGNYSVSLGSATVGINMTDTVLTVPWGVLKGDSLIDQLILGPNMAWGYYESPVSEDSAYNIVRTGDQLTIYAFGNQLQQMDFKIVVNEPANDIAKVFPMRNKDFTTGFWTPGSRFYVTDNQPVIDTIGDVPFATRVDTLFKYLLKAPDAEWQIAWVDGIERVDLKTGDKLKVTATDGVTVKEYFIDVQDFAPSSNASLSAITWPDIPEVLEGWTQDTIPFFQPDRFSYFITLPYGTTGVPALVASTQNLNADVKVKRAVSLKGTAEDRTTVFTVTAQDDTTILEYSVTFDVETIGEQVFKAEPFFSQIVHKHFFQNSFFELTNPGNVPLSLDEYIVIQSNSAGSPADAITANLVNDEANWARRYYKYVPGFRFQSLENWIYTPGLLDLDLAINPALNPGEVFVIGRLHNTAARRPAEQIYVDIHFSASLANVWGEMGWSNNAMCWTQPYSIFYLFKIENDSVLEGKKPVGDPNDYRLIDMFGSAGAENWTVGGLTTVEDGWSFIRKPDIWKGNPESKGSWGTNPDDSEWTTVIWGGTGTDWAPVSVGIGTHVINPVTVYVSTVSSPAYLISDGFEGLQTIQGDVSGLTVENFYALLVKGDTAQVLSMKSGIDGSLKTLEDLVAGDDTLVVVSADGNNTTKYLLINQPLDSDALLVAREGSGYVIEVNNETGTISGMIFGAALKEVLDNIIKPDKASMTVIDENGQPVPLKMLNYELAYLDTKVGDAIYLEVVAQDGLTVITYKISPDVLASDAYVISTIYQVDQDSLIISKIPFGTSVSSFFARIEPAGNATVKLVDKAGFQRELGSLSYDDRVEVTSEDLSNTVTYSLDFLDELNPDRPEEHTGAEFGRTNISGSILAYPNPASDRFYIKGLAGGEDIYLTDIVGRILLISTTEEIEGGISLAGQPAGIYMIIAVDSHRNINYARVIKK